jgi:hypothetical protein
MLVALLAIAPGATADWALAQPDGNRVVASRQSWNAGVARVNITPDHDMWMAGYASRNRPAEGKLTDLWAKALALEDAAGNQAVLVTLDLVGIDRELARAIGNRIHQAYRLERHQIALCTSHTHTGPVVGRNLAPLHYLQLDVPQRTLVDQYTQGLEEKVVQLVGRALERRAACRLSWASGVATFAVNRRNNPEQQVPELRTSGLLRGPYDHDVPVLSVHDTGGSLMAVVFGYACHATVLDLPQWSGDYPGFAQIELERVHPGCVAMFWAGCGADQNPVPRRDVKLAQQYGKELAGAVDEVLKGEMTPLAPALFTSYREIELPLDTLPSRDQLEQDASSSDRFVAARAQMLLAKIDAAQPLQQSYPYPVALWKIGNEVHFVLLGGEVVVDYALRLKRELGGKKTWVAGYTNDVMAYIPSRRVLREGGYEGGGAMVYYGLPAVWAPEIEALIVNAVHEPVAHRDDHQREGGRNKEPEDQRQGQAGVKPPSYSVSLTGVATSQRFSFTVPLFQSTWWRRHRRQGVKKRAHVFANDVANQAADERRAVLRITLGKLAEAKIRIVEGIDQPPNDVHAIPQWLGEGTQPLGRCVVGLQGLMHATGRQLGRGQCQEQARGVYRVQKTSRVANHQPSVPRHLPIEVRQLANAPHAVGAHRRGKILRKRSTSPDFPLEHGFKVAGLVEQILR